jgi:hypothetical protein
MPYQQGIDGIGCRVTERQEIYGIEDVGLAHAVASYHAINLWRKVKCGLPYVLIVDE